MIFDGTFIWIWNVRNCDGGNPDVIAQRCRQHGVTGVLVKSDDGGAWFDQGQPWPAIAAALRANGLVVAAWGYHYLDDWAAEADRAIETIQSGVCDAYVSDLEAESEGKARQCEAFFRRIRAAVGDRFPIGYAPLPVIDYHQSLPYLQANAYADVVIPQFYGRLLSSGTDGTLRRHADGSPLWSVDRLWEQWERWSAIWRAGGHRVPPIRPAFDAFLPGSAEDIPAYIASLTARQIPGCSFWSYEHLTKPVWAAIGASSRALGEQTAEATGSTLPPVFAPYGRDWVDAANNLKGIADEANRRRQADRADAGRALELLRQQLAGPATGEIAAALQRILDRNADMA